MFYSVSVSTWPILSGPGAPLATSFLLKKLGKHRWWRQLQTACQFLWQTLKRDPCCIPPADRLQDKPEPQLQRWKISGPGAPSFCPRLEHTWPSVRTGLQILAQKWRAQHSPGAQSDVRRQLSPSWAGGKQHKTKSISLPCPFTDTTAYLARSLLLLLFIR